MQLGKISDFGNIENWQWPSLHNLEGLEVYEFNSNSQIRNVKKMAFRAGGRLVAAHKSYTTFWPIFDSPNLAVDDPSYSPSPSHQKIT